MESNEKASFSSGELTNTVYEDTATITMEDLQIGQNVGYGMAVGGAAVITSILILGIISIFNRA